VAPLKWFQLCKAAGVFDYINWLPADDILEECLVASEATDLPMTTGNCIHVLNGDNARLIHSIDNAARVRMSLLNIMLNAHGADGHELTDKEILDLYGRAADRAARKNVEISFELHVDCWSEKYKRVTPIIEAAKARGYKFNFTIDYSHVIFKIDNPEQQDISDVREDVEEGRVILDPFEEGNLCAEWLAHNVVSFAQFRPAAPNGPRNIWARNDDGSIPRGIFYPIARPAPGTWYAPWSAHRLSACKEAFRTIMRYHLTHDDSPLRFVITEVIARPDYGLNAKFSLLEQNALCASWIRAEWAHLKAMHAAGIPLITPGVPPNGHLHACKDGRQGSDRRPQGHVLG
jgi:hypothetical protein